ncbi:MAG: phosphoribosylamine--glycine ligase [Gammaproteobacteria bacterium]|nr:phosphoribosylamine--glycine ligase [Gammaproteobacteria bacterium]MBT8111844.1 phosphoribosylamine--glycine ligase [Gammaproteobacteria bacterium]NND48508.1 phosphoribosylamine--glycine ligase [Woeseiaceae bacterium]NNL46543.1 phosphoribosylamine--glycine ligase [Woeseiaceae bacterium]
MKILIIGSGGREHALAWKCAQSVKVDEVLVAPGNAGTARENKVRNVAVSSDDIDGLLSLAQEEDIGLAIVGPEAPLVAGIVDRFNALGLPCFGPTAAAARLEGSKAFTKDFLARHDIPTAAYRNFTELQPALEYIREQGAPIVIKADGLAAGKGVIVAMRLEEAEQAATDMLAGGSFGDAGARIVVEEFLDGEEASFIIITDGDSILPLATSQDHKARDEGDVGPNTGGMGAYSPAPVVTTEVEQRIMDLVIRPTLAGMKADGHSYLGFLYAGLMIMSDGTPRVIEFNCRMGDPETQPILMRLESDLVEICAATLNGTLSQQTAEWDSRAALGVVLAAGGYPASYAKGKPISGLDKADSDTQKVFHAGTAGDGKTVTTDGGRVVCVVGLGETVAAAAKSAYESVDKIKWQDVYFRRDIGHRAIARES